VDVPRSSFMKKSRPSAKKRLILKLYWEVSQRLWSPVGKKYVLNPRHCSPQDCFINHALFERLLTGTGFNTSERCFPANTSISISFDDASGVELSRNVNEEPECIPLQLFHFDEYVVRKLPPVFLLTYGDTVHIALNNGLICRLSATTDQ